MIRLPFGIVSYKEVWLIWIDTLKDTSQDTGGKIIEGASLVWDQLLVIYQSFEPQYGRAQDGTRYVSLPQYKHNIQDFYNHIVGRLRG